MTSLIGLMLTLIWIKDGSDESPMVAPSSCAAGSKEAISNISTSDEYNGDGTQIEKVLGVTVSGPYIYTIIKNN